jgi:hypothetical protein
VDVLDEPLLGEVDTDELGELDSLEVEGELVELDGDEVEVEL